MLLGNADTTSRKKRSVIDVEFQNTMSKDNIVVMLKLWATMLDSSAYSPTTSITIFNTVSTVLCQGLAQEQTSIVKTIPRLATVTAERRSFRNMQTKGCNGCDSNGTTYAKVISYDPSYFSLKLL